MRPSKGVRLRLTVVRTATNLFATVTPAEVDNRHSGLVSTEVHNKACRSGPKEAAVSERWCIIDEIFYKESQTFESIAGRSTQVVTRLPDSQAGKFERGSK